MKTIAVGGFLLVSLGIATIGINGPAQNGKQTPVVDAEFKALIDKYYIEWSSMKAVNVAQLYAKDADLVFYDIAPLKYKGWEEYAVGVKKNFFDTATSARLTPNEDLKVTRHGNLAWTSVTFHVSAKLKNGQNLEVEGRHTAIWEKRGGKWLIVHEHVSAPLAG